MAHVGVVNGNGYFIGIVFRWIWIDEDEDDDGDDGNRMCVPTAATMDSGVVNLIN